MLYKDYLENRKPYQEYGHLFLLERKHCCLFYKPGKGKTYPCVDAARDVDKAKGGKAKVLVLSTADAIKNMWNAEIMPQGIMPADTVTVSFTSAIQEKRKPQLLKIKWDVIIVDECHKIKAHNSKISKLVYQLSKKVEYCWGLSGTPRGNTDIDIFCQFHNMNVGEWGKITYTQFVEQCCDIEQKFFGGQMIRQPIGINHRYKGGWERNVAMYSQRIEYTDEDAMPNLTVNTINLPYIATKEYINAEEGVVNIPDFETTMTKLAAITKLHQIVNGFMYLQDDTGKKITYKIGYNDKLTWLKANYTPRCTIVYRFVEDLMQISNALDEIGVTYTEVVEEFKSGAADTLLLQCSRCESFNLQMCDRIIFYTLDYSYIKYNQMLHRVWRIGQTKKVNIDVLLFENTVETKIWCTVQNKEKLADLFMSIKGGF